ncbi:MAG: heme-binding protein [Candidatus Dormibacteraeota bacterium]|nr:heme-binding protein [Candidatus Dormibacteraeota bacterium]
MSEQLSYAIEQILEGVEVRGYPPIVLATVRDMPDNYAFRILFKYISGSNRATGGPDQAASTSAVGETIAMTVPVFSTSNSFSFVMPGSYSKESTPEPQDPRSIVEGMPARRVAALRLSGFARERTVASKSRQLLHTLARHELRTRGTTFLMRYSAPSTPGFLRRNEEGIELVLAAQERSRS